MQAKHCYKFVECVWMRYRLKYQIWGEKNKEGNEHNGKGEYEK